MKNKILFIIILFSSIIFYVSSKADNKNLLLYANDPTFLPLIEELLDSMYNYFQTK